MAKGRHGRHRRGGRTTPKGTRPGHPRSVPSLSPVSSLSPFGPGDSTEDLIRSGGREVLAESEAVQAEAWASHLLAVFDRALMETRLRRDEVPGFVPFFLEGCGRRPTPEALAVATSLAAVAPPPHDRLAGDTVARLRATGVTGPDWLTAVGSARGTDAWLVTDVYDDQDVLIIGVAHDDGHEHPLVVLVDHNLDGQAKDAWIGENVDEVVDTWKSNTGDAMTLERIDLDEAWARLRAAMAAADFWNGDTALRTEDFADHRALAWAWLRRAGHGGTGYPERPEIGEGERARLVADFLVSPEIEGVPVGRDDVELLAHHLVDLRCDYEGRPLRWSPSVVASVLMDLAPRKLSLGPSQITALPYVLRAFVRFAGRLNGLAPRWVDDTLHAVDELETDYVELMNDPAAAGPAKLVLGKLLADGVDLSDPGAVDDAIAAINADGGLDALVGTAPRQPTGATRRAENRKALESAAPEVVASAAAAPVLARFDTLAAFYSEGRKLTQKGNPTLADTRELVDLLDLDDRMDPVIGDKIYKTRSAGDLPQLRYTLEWALRAGVVRKQHGRLLATVGWRRMGSRPLQRFAKAAEALERNGPLTMWARNGWPWFRQMAEFVDSLTPLILSRLTAGPAPFGEVLDLVCQEADEVFGWAESWEDPKHPRRTFANNLDRLSMILGWAGVLTRDGAEEVPDDFWPDRTRTIGGALTLTPAGFWLLETG